MAQRTHSWRDTYQEEQRKYAYRWPGARRPSERQVDVELAAEREASRARAQKRIDEQREVSKARYEREDESLRRYHAGLPRLRPEERIAEVQASMAEAAAAEAERKERERIEREEFVTEYTPKQRQEISIYESAKSRIQGDDSLNEATKVSMAEALDRKIASFQKVRRPRGPGDPPILPEHWKPGEEFQDAGGNWHLVQPDGSSKMTLRWDQSKEALEMQLTSRREAKEQEKEARRDAERESFARKLRTETVKEIVLDGDGKEKEIDRYLEPWEVHEKMLRAYPELGIALATEPATIQRSPVPQEEPPEIQQARAISKTWGVGLAESKKAKDLLKAWEYSQRKRGKHTTKEEYDKLPSGAVYMFNGVPMRK